MKLLIQKLLRENLLEARTTINDTADLAILSLDNNSVFILINIKTNEPLGYISFSPTDGDVYGIYGAYAKEGYGPLLYELAMTQVYPKGITMSDDSTTSDDALNVWEKFMARPEVKKKPIKRTHKTEKEEILATDFNKGDERYKEWVKNVLKLHYTQFIYDIGKDKLNQLIEKGNLYMKKHPNLDTDKMIYDLES